MENLFRPGKWLVLFCGVFILLYGVLQYVSNTRLKQEATIVGATIFTWSWPGGNFESQAKITDANVVQKGSNDAVVKVKGTQVYKDLGGPENKVVAAKTETVDCSATLHFYRMSNKNKDYWVLGKVEIP